MVHANRIMWADLLRIFSIFGVIMIHCSAPYLVGYKSSGSSWWTGNLYDSFSRWCIPVFFMLSGTFILEQAQQERLGRFYLRRIQRIIIPFFFWSAAYFLWRIFFNKEPISFADLFWLFLREPAYYHLWFIYTLIGLYILSPVIGIYLKHAGKRDVTSLLIVWFAFGSLIPTVESISGIETYLSIKTPSYIFYYSGYFILGYILKDIRLKGWWLIFMGVLFSLAFFVTAYGTWYLTVKVKEGIFADVFYNYYSVNVLMMATAVFLAVKSIRLPRIFMSHKVAAGVLGSVAACIPGIYLVHAMIISLLKSGRIPFTVSEDINPVIGIPFFAFIILIVSCGLVYVIRLVPGLKNLIP